MMTSLPNRRLPIGAEVLSTGGTHFRVWAPRRRKVEVVLEGSSTSCPLAAEGNGYFSGTVAAARAGSLYRFCLDGESPAYPDPASRFQPQGPHGPSQVVDPSRFAWTDQAWKGVGREGQVIYEMHIGTFTPEGTYETATQHFPSLAELGITVLEIMPVAAFPGRFGWGYDGVDLFAPTQLYGTPDDLRRFVDRAHAAGLGVILDVVHNHVGPDGNYLRQYSEDYFTDRYQNEWGEALNFDGNRSDPVREFFIANAGYWIAEFHFDGLRLDATQQIFDRSPEHILTAVTRRVRAAAGRRATYVVAENESQEARLARPTDRGGYGLDALWNDDFHHSAWVVLSGHNEAYYSDFRGSPQEFISSAKYGYLFQGQHYSWHKKRRGHPALDLPPAAFVTFIQNHDQVANSARGLRCHQLASPGRYRAMTALWLLLPGTPMFFQGQEFAASSPFLFFADHNPELARLVKKGRGEFLAQFPSIARPEMRALLPDPADPRTFERCRLDWAERDRHVETLALHCDLLRLRRDDPVLHAPRSGGLDGAVLAPEALVLRFFGGTAGDRLLVVNFAADLHLDPAPEPLLAPLEGARWETLWSSEDPRYGGRGTPPLDNDDNWRLLGHAAVVLVPRPV
jgi:maltooligosyltrehalose trehalohydrolase